jgi:alkanesulfonate monooxygenase SsuD/methylene tetrahydromethanopterin reductase-like flavin-dependent oxidoreductase (luciferase family)
MRVVEFAISVPQLYPDGTFDREALRAYLIRAEDLGFSRAWVTEQVVGTAPNLDPSVLPLSRRHTRLGPHENRIRRKTSRA